MFLFFICCISSYPIELLGFKDNHAQILVNTEETFSLSLISNGDLDNREDWKPAVTYRPKRLSEDESIMYVDVSKSIRPNKYYAYRLRTKSGVYFTKAFFKDDEDGFVMTSEYDDEPRRIRNKKDNKKDKKDDEDNDDKSFNDVIINISILLFIVFLVMIIVSFSMCSL